MVHALIERNIVHHLSGDSRYATLPFLSPLFKEVLTGFKLCINLLL
jgi:hypothetical protein